MSAAPVLVRVRMYRVGFGDCFLLSLRYAAPFPDGREWRHALIDYGSTSLADDGPTLDQIGDDIAATCDRLDLLVATHRHRDHISGFGGESRQRIIRALDPRRVLRPWTDDPGLPEDATQPAEARTFARALAGAQELAGRLDEQLRHSPGNSIRRELWTAAAHQVANEEAMGFLSEIAGNGRGRYVAYGSNPDLTEILPGVQVRVLGPPTMKDWPQMATQRADVKGEYWIRLAALADASRLALPAPRLGDAPAPRTPDDRLATPQGPVRQLIRQMQDQSVHGLSRLVETVENALNNTSVILLFTVGGRRLLFPGDAQWECWSYALGLAETRAPSLHDALTKIDLYKVGHHGSRNATPKKLYGLWGSRTPARRPLLSMVSTKPGVHGDATDGTEVPRATLLAALRERGPLIESDVPGTPGDVFVDVELAVSGATAPEVTWTGMRRAARASATAAGR